MSHAEMDNDELNREFEAAIAKGGELYVLAEKAHRAAFKYALEAALKHVREAALAAVGEGS